MDSQWQLSKCDSTWQSSAEPAMVVASSPVSQVHSQDPSRNSMINPSHCTHPHTGQEPCSSTRKMMADPMFQTTNINLFNSSFSVMGTSFFTLLSGSPSSSQYDSQQVFGSKAAIPSSKVHVFNSSTVGRTEHEASFGPPKLSSHNINNRYLRSKTDTFPVVPIRTLASDGGNTASCLHDVVQARKANYPSLELSTEANFHNCHGIERLNGFSSLKAVPISGQTTAQSEKLHSSSTPHQPSPLKSGLPRVFCLYASGDLFLTNSGLLGVVCSCHGFHMSISKFSEHSGLRDVNPGDAIHMDSGETIAQWRKVYFCKFGIRIPEDQCGWHWPEGFSSAADLVKSSERVSNLMKSSDLSNSVGPPRPFVASKQPLSVVFPDKKHPCQNLVNEIPCHELERNAHDNHKLPNGFTVTSQKKVHSGAGNKVMELPVSGCLSRSKLVGGMGDTFQSGSTYTDPIYKTRNSSTAHESLQNLKSLRKNADKFNNAMDGGIRERPTASSNIELRLGQPSEHSQILPGYHIPHVSSVGHPLELISSRPLLYNGSNKITAESEQFVNCAAQAAKFSSTKGQNQLRFSNIGFSPYSATMAHQPEQSKGDVVAGSVNSMLLSHLGNPKDKVQTKDSHSGAEDCQVMPKQQYVGSRISKLDSRRLGCNIVNSNKVKFSLSEMENYKLMDREKGLGRAAKKVESGCPVKFMGYTGSSFGFGKTSHDQSSYVQKILSNNPFHVTDATLAFDHPKTIFTLEKGEHGFSTPISSQPVSPRPPSVSGAPSIVFSSMGMNSSNMTSTIMSNEEGNRVMNLHASPSTKTLKYSNECIFLSSRGFDKDKNVPGNSLNENLRSSITLLSESTERRDGYKLASKFNLLELATKSIHSGTTSWISGAADKSALTSASQVASFQIGDIGGQSNHLCDCYQTGPQLPRIGISENIWSSSGCESCCQGTSCAYVPEKCSCWVQRSSTIGNSDLEGKKSVGAFGELSQIRASMLSASNLDKDRVLHARSISSGKVGETMKPNLKKVEFNAFQWKDVPSKMSERCHPPCKDQTKFLNERNNDNDQTSDVAHKCFDQSVQKADCMKEQVMSNISSKCSAPAFTQASVKISNGDSCTDDAQNTGCAKIFAVDEGSGIQKSWYSDDALDSDSNIGFDGYGRKLSSKNDMSSKEVSNRSTRSLIDELRVIDSLRSKKIQNQVHTKLSTYENSCSMKTIEKDLKAAKRKRETKFRILGTSFPASPVSSVSTGSSGKSSQFPEEVIVVQHSQKRSKKCTCSVGQCSKRRSTMPDSLTVCCMKDVDKLDKSTNELPCKTKRRGYDDSVELPDSSHGKRVRLDLDFSKMNIWNQEVSRKRIARPVVCGRYGLISNGDSCKPEKIFSLRKILKTAKRCATPGNEALKKSRDKTGKKSTIREGKRRMVRISNFNEVKYHVDQGAVVFSNDDTMEISRGTKMACSPQPAKDTDTSYMLEKGRELRNERSHSIPDSILGSRTRRKSKNIRKRSLYELITEGKDSGFATTSRNVASVPQNNLKNSGNNYNLHGLDNRYRSPEEPTYNPTPGVDLCCHVCGSSNNDEINCLLECNQCLIKVHQACYGIPKVPKSCWHCRPCRENATNMVCVLCGYEGGVMTRAVQSSNIVRSLLNAWNVVIVSHENPIMPPQVLKDQLNADAHSGNKLDIDATPNTILEHMKASSEADMMVTNSSCPVNKTMVLKRLTAGIFDSTVKQWVHMVCGLWTPGTRCPVADTMSAFDVSGASCPKENMVCSMCKRAGGCCIKCRVMDCAIHFHPWCAHLKGLLQNEVEGADNDRVGFYGKCELHATEEHCNHKPNSQSIQVASLHEKETCARTEGYKGRKREGFRHENQQNSNNSGGCLVRQEQVDAWNHINRQLSFKRRLQRMPQPVTDLEYDFRKEYTRYKQSKGWKHLVVYKSGIHALGLYTSLFISQSAMVVEYVGEIVGLRVADRREIEYQSGKHLQYKSACYFFRIDKEHIIDATRKGGIARFVNHSCQPNCAAKVMTVWGEKKVVFFAERDIYPGEEITYDYHFNNEEEGEKIFCSCNSNNCRRYLN